MVRIKASLVFLLSIIIFTQPAYTERCSAAPPYVEAGDLLSYGYRLEVDHVVIDYYNREAPAMKRLVPDIVTPEGLFNALIGMALHTPKDITVLPEEGFTFSDPYHPELEGKTLYYYALEVYEINGVSTTEEPDDNLGLFGYYFLRIGLGVLGFGAVLGLIYFGYRYYPKIFGKRCLVCNKSAIGKCTKCNKAFCERCYSNGCPACKSRTLIHFKR